MGGMANGWRSGGLAAVALAVGCAVGCGADPSPGLEPTIADAGRPADASSAPDATPDAQPEQDASYWRYGAVFQPCRVTEDAGRQCEQGLVCVLAHGPAVDGNGWAGWFGWCVPPCEAGLDAGDAGVCPDGAACWETVEGGRCLLAEQPSSGG